MSRLFFSLLSLYQFIPLLTMVVFAGGPDQAGYRFIDSDTISGPVFNWVDITGSGTQLHLGDDDNQGPFWLGWTFPFYAENRESVYVCSNGWLSFTSNSHQFHHYPIPNPRDPNSLIGPLWLDLDPSQGGEVYYLTDIPNGRFVLSWVGVPLHNTSDSCTFQVIIENSGNILFQYLKVPPGLDSCTVGIENDSGTVGLEYFFDGAPLENRLHDSLAIKFYQLEHDVCPVAILRPTTFSFVGDSIKPLVMLWNPGTKPAEFPVTLRINPGYEEQITKVELRPFADTIVQFPVWVPDEDSYSLQVFTTLTGDEFRANDTIFGWSIGSYQSELGYDDGKADTWFIKVGAPTYDWGVGVRFSVPYEQFRLLGTLVFLNDTLTVQRVVVCPDSGGLPQLGNPYFQVESVRVFQPETWLDLKTDTVINTQGDLWLVVFWSKRATGPKIGVDLSTPIDQRSFFGSPQVGWIPYPEGDLMLRLRINGKIGIRESPRIPPNEFKVQVHPNPCRGQLMIEANRKAKGRIRDVSGRVVRRFTIVAPNLFWAWDGRNEEGEPVSTGVYFIEFDNTGRPNKVLFIR